MIERDCLVCGDFPSERCHYPTHRGMGGGKAGWADSEWVPLCQDCHDALDGKNGASAAACLATQQVRAAVADAAPLYFSKVADESSR